MVDVDIGIVEIRYIEHKPGMVCSFIQHRLLQQYVKLFHRGVGHIECEAFLLFSIILANFLSPRQYRVMLFEASSVACHRARVFCRDLPPDTSDIRGSPFLLMASAS